MIEFIKKHNQPEKRSSFINHVLIIFLLIYLSLIITGSLIFLSAEGKEKFELLTIQQSFDYSSLTRIYRSAMMAFADHIILAGIVLLMLMPVIRVVHSFFSFIKEKDIFY